MSSRSGDSSQETSSWAGSGGEKGKDPQGPLGVGSDLPPPFPPSALSPLPRCLPICFLQFVKSVVIFLGAFLLFFKFKIYLYYVFKVVKKKNNHKTKPNESAGNLSVGTACDNYPFCIGRIYRQLAACSSRSRRLRRKLTHTHTYTRSHMLMHTCQPTALREASGSG